MDINKLPITLCLYNQVTEERIDNLFKIYAQYFEKVEVISEEELLTI